MDPPSQASQPSRSCGRGFTLVELLIVVVVIGVLSTITVFGVRGITERGRAASCATDARLVAHAADVYLANTGQKTIPAIGTDADRFERTLVDAGFLRDVSEYHSLAADGAVISNGAPCD